MESNKLITVRQLGDGRHIICDGDGNSLLVSDQGRLLRAPNGGLMTMKMQLKKEREAQGEKLIKPAIEEYSKVVNNILEPRLNLRTRVVHSTLGPLSDAKFNYLNVLVAEEFGYQMKKTDLQASCLHSAENSAYDPVTQYLQGVGQSEDQVLTDTEWHDIAKTLLGVDGEYERKVLQRFLIGAVKRAFEPGSEMQFAMILKGDQGIGKSQFFKILAGEWFSDSMGDLQKIKDDCLILHMHWICEWGEVDQVFGGAKASERVKRFVSSSEDALRVPYGRNTVAYPRRSVIVGTTNRDDWATDFTGNRRFPVIEPNSINREELIASRNRIWGRAVVEYRRGTQDYFSKEEGDEVSRRTAAYAPEDVNATDALAFMHERKGRWFAARDIAMGALQWDQKTCTNANLRSLARSLNALRTQGIEAERRMHYPENGAWGGKGTKNCWRSV